jgi:hypothetical protein
MLIDLLHPFLLRLLGFKGPPTPALTVGDSEASNLSEESIFSISDILVNSSDFPPPEVKQLLLPEL